MNPMVRGPCPIYQIKKPFKKYHQSLTCRVFSVLQLQTIWWLFWPVICSGLGASYSDVHPGRATQCDCEIHVLWSKSHGQRHTWLQRSSPEILRTWQQDLHGLFGMHEPNSKTSVSKCLDNGSENSIKFVSSPLLSSRRQFLLKSLSQVEVSAVYSTQGLRVNGDSNVSPSCAGTRELQKRKHQQKLLWLRLSWLGQSGAQFLAHFLWFFRMFVVFSGFSLWFLDHSFKS